MRPRWFHRRGCTALAVCLLALVISAGSSSASDLELKGRSVTVIYSDTDQLKTFFNKISPGVVSKTITRIMSNNPSDKNTENYLDQILTRVQVILDMPTPGMKVKVKLYNNAEEVSALYKSQISKGTTIAHQSANPLAFYWKKDNTIHIQVEQIHLGMLAHEMAHAVMFHYFIPPPPLKIQEMLAGYVDREINYAK